MKNCYGSEPERAGRLLMMIESEMLRGELLMKLAAAAAFVASASNMERLIVACGSSVPALAALVANLAPARKPRRCKP